MTSKSFAAIAAAVLSQSAWAQEQPTTEEVREIVVTGERDYSNTASATASKLNVPLRDIPQSVQSVSEDLIRDRGPLRIQDIGQTVSGVAQATNGYSRSAAFYVIRGFPTDGRVLRNGFRDFGYLAARDVQNLGRVDFLKGPASVLYGAQQSIGGAVNFILKQPTDKAFVEVGASAGSFDLYRGTIDAGGAIGPMSTRLNLAFQDAGSHRDFIKNNRLLISPAASVKVGPRTEVSVTAEYVRDRGAVEFGLPLDPIVFSLPRSRTTGEPALDRSNSASWLVQGLIDHRFSDSVRLRSGINIAHSDFPASYAFPLSIDSTGNVERLYYLDALETSRDISWQTDLTIDFNTGGISHKVLFGTELAYQRYRATSPECEIGTINAFRPVYGQRPTNCSDSDPLPRRFDTRAAYFSDLISFSDQWKLLVGARYDHARSRIRNERTGATTLDYTAERVTPRVGLVYQPTTQTALFGGYSESFYPSVLGRFLPGDGPKPEFGKQYEAGVKQDFFNRRLNFNFAIYQLTRQNVATPNPANRRFSIQTGEQRSRGVELDVNGQIEPNWNVTAAYTYTDAKVTRDNDIPVGDRRVGVPKNAASLFSVYEVASGPLTGLSIGGGVFYVGKVEASLPNTITVDATTRVDLTASYRLRNYTLQLNVQNVGNERIYVADGYGIVPQPGRAVFLTLRGRFD